jgi:hypothetical protein
MDANKEMLEEGEAVNAAEELLLKARRVGWLIGERVKAVLAQNGTPALHAPGVELPASPDE